MEIQADYYLYCSLDSSFNECSYSSGISAAGLNYLAKIGHKSFKVWYRYPSVRIEEIISSLTKSLATPVDDLKALDAFRILKVYQGIFDVMKGLPYFWIYCDR